MKNLINEVQSLQLTLPELVYCLQIRISSYILFHSASLLSSHFFWGSLHLFGIDPVRIRKVKRSVVQVGAKDRILP